MNETPHRTVKKESENLCRKANVIWKERHGSGGNNGCDDTH
jgi:hypothetical protein